jgi:formylglycine-generating enzyme required for sulfatase activity
VGLALIVVVFLITRGDLVAGNTMIREIDSAVMVYVPGGEFQMGSSEADIDAVLEQCEQELGSGACSKDIFEDESPQHTVTLDAFWIDQTEVTNAQYAPCVADGDCRELSWAGDATYNGENYPVVGVSWQDAADYCAWAGARLPTEAEWEYAARGPDGYIYPWGDTFDGARLNFCDANCTIDWSTGDDDGYEETAPVGSYLDGASWCGALDMVGNVWEWVNDWYQEDYYVVSPASNPPGPESGSVKVLRGGSWYVIPSGVRSARRYWGGPDFGDLSLGFRCVVASTSSLPS